MQRQGGGRDPGDVRRKPVPDGAPDGDVVKTVPELGGWDGTGGAVPLPRLTRAHAAKGGNAAEEGLVRVA